MHQVGEVAIEGRSVSNGILPIRVGFNEWLGALGDLGTFVPIFLSLVALNGIPPARTLFLVGLVYLGSALYFRLPIPVQPLKAMSAIAIAGGLGTPMIAAAGIWMGSILLSLSLGGRVEWLSRYFTRPIVKGVQLGVGLMLIKTSLGLIKANPHTAHLVDPVSASTFPYVSELPSALWLLVLPQLPLTLENAVFAVSDVAHDYFGHKARRVRPKNLTVSLGLANLTIGLLGGLPVCHGSGGLTAHYRFGARTGGATLIAGAAFMVLALIFSWNGVIVLSWIPHWVLGLMLLYVGICHVLLIQGLKEGRLTALGMGLIGFVTSNLTYALALGLLIENVPSISRRLKVWEKVVPRS